MCSSNVVICSIRYGEYLRLVDHAGNVIYSEPNGASTRDKMLQLSSKGNVTMQTRLRYSRSFIHLSFGVLNKKIVSGKMMFSLSVLRRFFVVLVLDLIARVAIAIPAVFVCANR